jgi:hypothetical protein
LVAKNEIRQFWYLYNSGEDIMNMVWWEAPPGVGGTNNEGLAKVLAPNVPALERSVFDNPTTADFDFVNTEQEYLGESGAIGIVWKDRKDYYGQNPDEIIHPCNSATNPVRSGEFVYIGCRVGEGTFAWDESVPVDTFVIFKFRPDTTDLTYLGRTPLVGGEAKLGARSDGRLALASAGIDDGDLTLRIAYGSDNGRRVMWGGLDGYGNELDVSRSQQVLRDANVQQMIYREDSGVLHLLLKQVTSVGGTGLAGASQLAEPNINKAIVAIDERHGLLANMDLDIGNPLNRTDPTLLTATEDVYNDLSDGFLQLPLAPFNYNGKDLGRYYEEYDVNMYQREFFAVGDYGIVIFAEVIEITNLECPCPASAPNPPIPLAAPATSLSFSQVLVPAAGITIAGLMASSFAINRNKSHNAAAAKGKK